MQKRPAAKADLFQGESQIFKSSGFESPIRDRERTRTSYAPVPAITTPTVRTKILMSSHRLQFSIYAVSNEM
jgi:hypothetical protein